MHPLPELLNEPSGRWLGGGHLQTLVPALWRRRDAKRIPWVRERWDTPDRDFVDVDWLPPLSASAEDADRPVMVLFHGLEGSSDSHYACALATHLRRLGWAMAVIHFRGCSGHLNLAPRAYHSGDADEIQWMLARVRGRYPNRRIVAIGVSLGGNALMRWAGLSGLSAKALVDAAVAISSPLDLEASGEALGRGLNRHIYTPHFLRTMLPKAREKWAQHPGLFDLSRVECSRTLYDFDDAFTAPVHGFGNARRYWREASAKPVLKGIRVPTLLLNARNDPFVPAHSLPTGQDVSPVVTLWQPHHGGHVGFPPAQWPATPMPLTGVMPLVVMGWATQVLAASA